MPFTRPMGEPSPASSPKARPKLTATVVTTSASSTSLLGPPETIVFAKTTAKVKSKDAAVVAKGEVKGNAAADDGDGVGGGKSTKEKSSSLGDVSEYRIKVTIR